jgi:hypothetical protein
MGHQNFNSFLYLGIFNFFFIQHFTTFYKRKAFNKAVGLGKKSKINKGTLLIIIVPYRHSIGKCFVFFPYAL